MKNSQLIDIIQALTKKEVRELKKWLISPAHNHRDDVIQLFDYLLQGNHLEDDKFLEKERVFKKIFPDEPFDDAKLRQTMHFLLKAIEEYQYHQIIPTLGVLPSIHLAIFYRNRGISKAYHKLINTIQQNLKKSKIQDEDYYRQLYLLADENYNFRSINQPLKADLQEGINNIEINFIITKLRFSFHMMNHQAVMKKEYHYGLLESILEYVKEKNLLEIPAIKIYYFGYLSIKHSNDEKYYFQFKDSIFQYSYILSHSEMRDNYLLALNYCIKKINNSKLEFYAEAFELYKQGISNNVLFTDEGTLTYSTFRNIVNTGTIVKEFAWIYSFIKGYQQYLPKEQKEETIQFSLGKYYFEKGEYDKARDQLIYINPGSINLNLMIKSMLIRIYYSQDEFMLLDALLESMKVYINRKESLAQQYRRPFLNLIKYTKKLVKVNPYDKKAIAKLRGEIQAAQPLISKDWFLDQVDNL